MNLCIKIKLVQCSKGDFTMKQTYKVLLAMAVFATVSNMAMANGDAFTPLNFEDAPASYSAPAASPKATPAASKTNAAKAIPAKKDAITAVKTDSAENVVGNDNIQNAILELDNAQVGIRNDLLNYKAKYADADAQYKLIKNERSMLDKQVKSIERRIRNIDRAKEKIRKNML